MFNGKYIFKRVHLLVYERVTSSWLNHPIETYAQIGNLPQIGVKRKNISKHHLILIIHGIVASLKKNDTLMTRKGYKLTKIKHDFQRLLV